MASWRVCGSWVLSGSKISCIKGNISKEEVDDIKGVFEAFDMNGDISELSAMILSKQPNPIRRWSEIRSSLYC